MGTEMTWKCERGLRWVLGVMAIAAVVGVSSARTHASVEWVADCGAYLTGDETYVLIKDVGPCDGTAITVVGPAKLKLNGHTVSCALDGDAPKEDTIGIKLEWADADLIGGPRRIADEGGEPTNSNLVTGCGQGVVLADDGDHLVQGVTVTVSKVAFVVESDDNKLIGNVVRQGLAWRNSEPLEENGFVVEGNKNQLLGNVAADVDSEEGAGFTIEGNYNLLEDNIGKDNVGFGYHVLGNWNELRDNSALKNEHHGFFVAEEAEGNLLKHNKSFENGDEPNEETEHPGSGFYVEGSGNRLEENLASRNGHYGIHLAEGASDNVVSRNRASDSLGFTHVLFDVGLAKLIPYGTGGDLVDENFYCGTNRWSKNIFGVRNRSCIQ